MKVNQIKKAMPIKSAILNSNLLTLYYTYIIIVLIQNIAHLKTCIYLEYGKEYLPEAVNFRL